MNARWRATHIEPLLADLLPLSPILIIDVRDGIGMPDLLAFAGALSGLLVVLTSVMWPDMVEVMDLMDRRDNVLLSTSWLHSWRALELVADRFGPHRLVFGTGYRSHAGASIAGLARADLPGEARELIAHGTLDRLLGLDAPGPVEDPAPRPMWDNLLQGRSPGPEIIDAHGHIGPLGMYPLPETAPKDHVAAALQWMDALGISTMLISGAEALLADPVAGNMGLQEMLGPHGDRFGGYLAFNPRHAEALASRLDDFFAGDFFVGLKILCDYWRVPVTDPRLTPAWEYANAHRLPVLIHTWGGAHNAPHMLRSIAPRYPDAALILAHSGGSDRKGAVALAEADPNVYLEFAGSFTVPDSWADTIKRVGTDRVVFGTDAVAHSPYWELGRLLSQNIPEDQLVPILATNMSAILARRR